MRDAGADLFSLEMMVDIPRMTATLDAVSTLDLPVWVGFTIGPEEGHPESELPSPVPLREGGLLAAAVDLAKQYDQVDAMCLMHSDVRLTERGIATIRDRWDGPIAAYAHAAQVHDDDITFDETITPAEYAAYRACVAGFRSKHPRWLLWHRPRSHRCPGNRNVQLTAGSGRVTSNARTR